MNGFHLAPQTSIWSYAIGVGLQRCGFIRNSLHVIGETLVWHFQWVAILPTHRYENTVEITESMSMSESMRAAIVVWNNCRISLIFPFSATFKLWLRYISENPVILIGSTAFWFGIRANPKVLQTLVWSHELSGNTQGLARVRLLQL